MLGARDEEFFRDNRGQVAFSRELKVIWKANIYSGEANMCHSLANLELHHFKYETHRRPGDVHIHFVGADAFSFGVRLQDVDMAGIPFPALGELLRKIVRVTRKAAVRQDRPSF